MALQSSSAVAPFAPRDVLAAAVGAAFAGIAFAWGITWPLVALAVAGIVLAAVELWRVLRGLLSRRLRTALRMDTGDVPLHLRPSWLLLPDVERARFANIALQALWPFVRASMEPTLHTAIDAALEKSRPAAVLSRLFVSQLSLGNVPPELTGIKAYHPGASEYIVDLQVRVAADTATLELTAVPRGFTSLPLRVSVGDLAMQATVRVEARPLLPRPPFVGALHVSLLQPPTVDFQLRALGIDVLGSVPGLAPLLSAVLRHEIYRFALFPRSVTIAMPGAGDLPAGEAGAAAAQAAAVSTGEANALPHAPRAHAAAAGHGAVGASAAADGVLRPQLDLDDPRLGRICVAQPKLARPSARSRRATSDTTFSVNVAGGSPRNIPAGAAAGVGSAVKSDQPAAASDSELTLPGFDGTAAQQTFPPLPWAERDGMHVVARQTQGRRCATLLLHIKGCHGISVRPSRAAAVLNLRGAGGDEDEAADAAEAASAQAAWAYHSDEEAERSRARRRSESFAAMEAAKTSIGSAGSGSLAAGTSTPTGPSWEVPHHRRQRSGSASLLGAGLAGRPRESPTKGITASTTRPRAGSASTGSAAGRPVDERRRAKGMLASGSGAGVGANAPPAAAVRPRMFRLFSSHKPVTAVEAFVVPRSAAAQLDRLLASIVAAHGSQAALDAALAELRQGTQTASGASASATAAGAKTPGALHSLRLAAPGSATGTIGTRPRGGTRGSASSSDSRSRNGERREGDYDRCDIGAVARRFRDSAAFEAHAAPSTPPVYPRPLRTPVARDGDRDDEEQRGPTLSRSPIAGGIGFGAPASVSSAARQPLRRPPGGSAASSAAEPDGGRFPRPSAAAAASAAKAAGNVKLSRPEAEPSEQQNMDALPDAAAGSSMTVYDADVDVDAAAANAQLAAGPYALWFSKLAPASEAATEPSKQPTQAAAHSTAGDAARSLVASVTTAASEAALVADRILERTVNVAAGIVAGMRGSDAHAGSQTELLQGITAAPTGNGAAIAAAPSPSALQTAVPRSLSATLGLQAPHAGAISLAADADAATASAVQHVVRLWCSVHKYASWAWQRDAAAAAPQLDALHGAAAAASAGTADANDAAAAAKPASWPALFHAPATTALAGSDPEFNESLVLPSVSTPAVAFRRVHPAGGNDSLSASAAESSAAGEDVAARLQEADCNDSEVVLELLQYDPLYEATRHCAGAARLPLRALLQPDVAGGGEVSAVQAPAVASSGGTLGPLPGHTSPMAAAMGATATAAAVAAAQHGSLNESPAGGPPSHVLGLTLTLPIIGGTGNITLQAALYEEEPPLQQMAAAHAGLQAAAPTSAERREQPDGLPCAEAAPEVHTQRHAPGSTLMMPALVLAEQPGGGLLATALAGAVAPTALPLRLDQWSAPPQITHSRQREGQSRAASSSAVEEFAGLEPDADAEADALGAPAPQQPLPVWSPAVILPHAIRSTVASAGSSLPADASPERSPLASPLPTPLHRSFASRRGNEGLGVDSLEAVDPEHPLARPGHAYDSSAASSSSADSSDSAMMAMEAAAAGFGLGSLDQEVGANGEGGGTAASRSALAQRFFLLSPDEGAAAASGALPAAEPAVQSHLGIDQHEDGSAVLELRQLQPEAPPASPSSVSQLAAEFPDATLAAAEGGWGKAVEAFLHDSIAADEQAPAVDASRNAAAGPESAADRPDAATGSESEPLLLDRPAAPFDPSRVAAVTAGSSQTESGPATGVGGRSSLRSPLHSDATESLAMWPPDGQWAAPAPDALTGMTPAWPEPIRAVSVGSATGSEQTTPVPAQSAAFITAPATAPASGGAGQPGPRISPPATALSAGQLQERHLGHAVSAGGPPSGARRRAPSRTGLMQLSGGLLPSALAVAPTSLALIAMGGAAGSESLQAAIDRSTAGSKAQAGLGAPAGDALHIRAPAACAGGVGAAASVTAAAGSQPATPLQQQADASEAARQAAEQLRIQPAHVRAVQTGLFASKSQAAEPAKAGPGTSGAEAAAAVLPSAHPSAFASAGSGPLAAKQSSGLLTAPTAAPGPSSAVQAARGAASGGGAGQRGLK